MYDLSRYIILITNPYYKTLHIAALQCRLFLIFQNQIIYLRVCFLAIDNCLKNNCSHECVTDWNSPGGFRCACDLGYELRDGNNCIRMFI